MKHCSNCGERLVEGQVFCRACGAELVVGGGRRGFRPANLFFGGLLGVLVSALIVVLGGYIDAKTVAFVGTVLAIISMGVLMTGAFLYDTRRRRRRASVTANEPQTTFPTLEKAKTTNELPPISAADHFPTSVTEHTTTKLRVK